MDNKPILCFPNLINLSTAFCIINLLLTMMQFTFKLSVSRSINTTGKSLSTRFFIISFSGFVEAIINPSV